MINLNLKNTFLESSDLEKLAPQISNISKQMDQKTSAGSDFLGWKDLPVEFDYSLIDDINAHVKFLLSKKIEVLVVVGIGGSFAGAKAGIDMVLGEMKHKHQMEVIYIGESLSSTNLYQKLDYLNNKNFAINVISKSGTTTEPAIAFKFVRRLLEEKIGKAQAQDYIIATTDANKGVLSKMATKKGYKKFVIPDDIGGRFSVLTSVGLFPLACAGLNIKKVIEGAANGHSKYSSHDIAKNDAYKYAAARFLLSKKFPIELMVQFEPQMRAFSEWWKQLAGESEGKKEKGLWPSSAVFSTDLHSLGQFIQDGSKVLFETTLFVTNPKLDIQLFAEIENDDALNYLDGKSVQEVNKVVYSATIDAHNKIASIPMINIEIERMNEEAFGQLVYFFERAVAMTAYLQEVNPFDQPGVEIYKQNMFQLLGKK